MKIYGLGTDIVNIEKFSTIFKKNKLFKTRIFSSNETSYCLKKKNYLQCFSKRFAAKEAFSKALGLGISMGLKFKEIEVINDKFGKPNINISGNSKKVIDKLLKKKKFKTMLSLSDDNPYAVATVIILTK